MENINSTFGKFNDLPYERPDTKELKKIFAKHLDSFKKVIIEYEIEKSFDFLIENNLACLERSLDQLVDHMSGKKETALINGLPLQRTGDVVRSLVNINLGLLYLITIKDHKIVSSLCYRLVFCKIIRSVFLFLGLRT